jgi:endonuclease/exonuclease/phosphatase family metal-dependent hydrolase
MKLVSYNVENLFRRARALNLATWADGKDVLKKHATLNGIFNKPKYTAADKKRIVELMKELGIDKKDDGSEFVILRQNKGKLLKRPKAGGIEVVADGRSDWVGWLDLKIDDIDDAATRNTARVVKAIGADILAVVEVEDRPALVRFSDYLLPAVEGVAYDHVMLIDGNDERGIDVGIMMRKRYEITRMNSHVDDTDGKGRIFSRDCAEYWIRNQSGKELIVLVNHLKSKGFGTKDDSDEKRSRQARRIAQLYKGLTTAGNKNVAVVGDFNDTPDSDALKPLLKQTDLRDISEHADFDDGGRPGTFGNGTAANKIDYILLSPALFAKAKRGGIYRMGVWGGTNGDMFPHLPEITKPSEAASDHAAIWAEIDI